MSRWFALSAPLSGFLVGFSWLVWGRVGLEAAGYGAALGVANVAVVTGAWRLVLDKKRIALAIGIIVIKYALFMTLLRHGIVRWNWHVGGLGVGLGVVVATSLIHAALLGWSEWSSPAGEIQKGS